MLRQAGSFSKITSMASGQGDLRRGVRVGAGMWTPGGSCGSCERSGSCSAVRESWSGLVSSGMLCDMLVAFLCLSTADWVASIWSVWQDELIVKGKGKEKAIDIW